MLAARSASSRRPGVLIDGAQRSLTVYRHTADGYLLVAIASAGEQVRAEPFEAIELDVPVLLGDDR